MIGWLRNRTPGAGRGGRRTNVALRAGLIVIAIAAVLVVTLYLKPSIETALTPGATIKAEFQENYRTKLYANETTVKLAGLEVGQISDIEYTERGTVLVSMKVDDGVLDKLGREPSASLQPRTLLEGLHSVELVRGGGVGSFPEDGVIPLNRTSLAVGLDSVLESLPRPTRESLRNVVARFDATLRADGQGAVRELLHDAPATLQPAGVVLNAARGTQPGDDLPRLVTNLEATAEVLTRQDGQLDSVVSNLAQVTNVLAAGSQPLAASIATLPGTLRDTRTGLTDLRGILDRLTVTADSARPTAAELDPLLRELNPVLVEARQLLTDLRPLLDDARPLVQQLAPVSQQATSVLDDLRGPVLERVNGPVLQTVLNTYRGSGPFEGSGDGFQADHKFYQELGYLVTNLDRGSSTQDPQGSLLSFQVGAGPETPTGFDQLSLPDLVNQLGRAAGGAR